ncbi:MAG: alpha/beta hydrolase [Candidatus Diapherotrites archaeon]|nr:alpha/beta hydrolase [Candidatus Diapherotrites archaeon]
MRRAKKKKSVLNGLAGPGFVAGIALLALLISTASHAKTLSPAGSSASNNSLPVTGNRAMLFEETAFHEPAQDLSYGPFPDQVLDWYPPLHRTQDPAPVIVFAHGGGFVMGDEAIDTEKDPWNALLEQGYAIASIRYRLSSTAVFPEQPKDLGKAIQFIRAHAHAFNADPERITAYGISAGGTLVSYVAFGPDLQVINSPIARERFSSRPNSAIIQNGATDWRIYDSKIPGVYFGTATLADVSQTTLEQASAVWHIENSAPPIPTLALYTTNISSAPLTNIHDAFNGLHLHKSLNARNTLVPHAFYARTSTPLAPLIADWLEEIE